MNAALYKKSADMYCILNKDIERIQDEMIEAGNLYFEGFGVRNRTRAHVEAYVEQQVARINKRRLAQGKPAIKADVGFWGWYGIAVSATPTYDVTISEEQGIEVEN